MSRNRHRLIVECLEQRTLLTITAWFVDSGQELSANHDMVRLNDVDGDGDLDAFLACRALAGVPSCEETEVWLNDGMGQFTKNWSSNVKGIAEVALADFDRDGDLDAFFTMANPVTGNKPCEIWLNDGHGNFSKSEQRLRLIGRAVAIGDVDSAPLRARTARDELPAAPAPSRPPQARPATEF